MKFTVPRKGGREVPRSGSSLEANILTGYSFSTGETGTLESPKRIYGYERAASSRARGTE